MNFKNKIILGANFLKSIICKANIPIVVSWAITDRCNMRCKYCSVWKKGASHELSTEQILKTIKLLSGKGTKIFKFTGGEPMLREDIATIINFSHKLGLYTSVSTNGFLFADKIKKIEKLDSVSISLDGPQEIQDSIRGKDAYRLAIAALDIAKRENISASLSTVLSSLNLNSLDYVFGIAHKYNAKVFFQPASRTILFGSEPNPLTPDTYKYKEVISYLVKSKSKNKLIGNSLSGLKHLYHWPQKRTIHCGAGKAIFHLDAQANIDPCSRFTLKGKRLNVIEHGFENCSRQLSYPLGCDECWCYSLIELNFILQLNPSAIINILNL